MTPRNLQPVSEGEYIEFAPVQDDDDLSNSAFSYVGGKQQVEDSYKKYFQKYGKHATTRRATNKHATTKHATRKHTTNINLNFY